MRIAARFFALAMLPAAFALAGPAIAYDETSTSTAILDSCKDFSLSDTTVLNATCNKVTVVAPGGSGSSDEVETIIETNETSIDLDDYVWNNAGTMKFDKTKQKGGFDDECISEHIEVYASSIPLGARCAKYADGCQPINAYGDVSETGCPKTSLNLQDVLINNTLEGDLAPKP